MHSSQEKSAEKSSIAKRLENLRVLHGWTWNELGARLGISVSMLYQVSRGDRTLSRKGLYRLVRQEVETGFLNPRDADLAFILDSTASCKVLAEFSKQARELELQNKVMRQLLAERMAAPSRLEFAADDFRRGYKELAVEYLFEPTERDHLPAKLRVSRVPMQEASRLIEGHVVTDLRNEIMLRALPKEFRRDAFLDLLTYASFLQLERAAFVLTFGQRDGDGLLNRIKNEAKPGQLPKPPSGTK